MSRSVAVFAKENLNAKILDSLHKVYDNVFYSHFSGCMEELCKHPYSHYWYVQNRPNIDILVNDLFDIEKIWRDKHRIFYLYKKNAEASLSLYSNYIYGFVGQKEYSVILETFNKPCIYY